jgi:DNA topoisomerase I
MGKKAVIVESPTKAKTISRYLGSDYIVLSTVGHIRDLPKSSLGVSVEEGFKPDYQVIKGKAKTIKTIKDAVKDADEVYLAPDPDREGEAIAWHISEILKRPVKRIEFHEVTKRAVQEALKHPREIDYDRVNAQQARRVLDRLVGYQISPLMWRKIKPGLSAGRVQSVAVRLICEREREIDAFVPKEYWTFEAGFEVDGSQFSASLVRIGDQRVVRPGEEHRREDERDGSGQRVISQEAEAVGLQAAIRQQQYGVSDLSTRNHSRKPSPPFTTSTMQQDAARKLGWTGKRTMRIAQELYEGIDLGNGAEGLITYMRTDSVRVNPEALEQVREEIGSRFGLDYLPAKPNFYKSKENAQEAHEAIRPTTLAHRPEQIRGRLSIDQAKLYQMIYERFMASQMNNAEFLTTAAEITGGEFTFRASATRMLFKGFLAIYGEERSADRGGDSFLPPLTEGQSARILEANTDQHYTKPPARFSDATLIKALEDNGIGRPSTYAPIIDTIIQRNYVVRLQKHFEPTEWGFVTNELMQHYFPNIVDIGFTREMEENLDRVEDGGAEWRAMLGQFYGPFKEKLDEAAAEKRYFKAQPKATGVECDKCGAEMVLRHGKYGRFLSCSAYPKCDNIKNIDDKGNIVDRPVTEAGQKLDRPCPKCSAELLVKVSRWGTKFVGCSAYPKCDYTSELQTHCPKCGAGLVKKRLPNRRAILVCEANDRSNGADCDFVLWGKPLLENCTLCNWFLAERKVRGSDRMQRYCSNPDCENHRGLPDDEDAENGNNNNNNSESTAAE